MGIIVNERHGGHKVHWESLWMNGTEDTWYIPTTTEGCIIVNGTEDQTAQDHCRCGEQTNKQKRGHRFSYYLSQMEFMRPEVKKMMKTRKRSIDRQPWIPWVPAVSRLEYHSLASWWHLVGSISISFLWANRILQWEFQPARTGLGMEENKWGISFWHQSHEPKDRCNPWDSRGMLAVVTSEFIIYFFGALINSVPRKSESYALLLSTMVLLLSTMVLSAVSLSFVVMSGWLLTALRRFCWSTMALCRRCGSDACRRLSLSLCVVVMLSEEETRLQRLRWPCRKLM
jgi:hypothetical protein